MLLEVLLSRDCGEAVEDWVSVRPAPISGNHDAVVPPIARGSLTLPFVSPSMIVATSCPHTVRILKNRSGNSDAQNPEICRFPQKMVLTQARA